jgi:hypothetical protein
MIRVNDYRLQVQVRFVDWDRLAYRHPALDHQESVGHIQLYTTHKQIVHDHTCLYNTLLFLLAAYSYSVIGSWWTLIDS